MAIAIKVNDTVAVIAGKEKGKRGRVLMVLPAEERVIVEKVNFIKRHTKPSQKQRQGGIIEKEGPIHLSNVQLYCKKCGKPVRVRTPHGRGRREEPGLRALRRGSSRATGRGGSASADDGHEGSGETQTMAKEKDSGRRRTRASPPASRRRQGPARRAKAAKAGKPAGAARPSRRPPRAPKAPAEPARLRVSTGPRSCRR